MVNEVIEPKRLIFFRQKHLQLGEEVLDWFEAFQGDLFEGGVGLLIATNNRLCFFYRQALADAVKSIEWPDLLHYRDDDTSGICHLTLATADTELALNLISNDSADELMELLTQRSCAVVTSHRYFDDYCKQYGL